MSHFLLKSQLHDEKSFYQVFIRDLERCQKEVYIESPYITTARSLKLIPIFKKLLNKGVKIYVMTRSPDEHDTDMAIQAEEVITAFEILGIQVLLCLGNHHRKLAILDRKVLWEESLNILSQTHSRELMRRIEEKEAARQMFVFLKLRKFVY